MISGVWDKVDGCDDGVDVVDMHSIINGMAW